VNAHDLISCLLESDNFGHAGTPRHVVDLLHRKHKDSERSKPSGYKNPVVQDVDRLERQHAASLDSAEGAEVRDTSVLADTDIPRSPADARKLGVGWFFKDGKIWTNVSRKVDNRVPFTNSKTMSMNRNKRRQGFGYKDTYSMRERGWPTGQRSSKAAARRAAVALDREDSERQEKSIPYPGTEI
jgi:hypothetical protein